MDILLGCIGLYYSIEEDKELYPVLVLLTSTLFFTAYTKLTRGKEKKCSKNRAPLRGNTSAAARPSLSYSDFGQKYVYVVRAEDTYVKCFSNYLFSPDSRPGLVDILIRDGKIEIEDGTTLEVSVNIRNGSEDE